MNSMIMIGIDLITVSLLTLAVYFPRHHRRDLVVAFFGVNVGVLAVSLVLGSTTVGAGLGLGLFGVLSIIRLRSSEISQTEVAYYFASLALGLLAGLTTTPSILAITLMILVVAVLAVADHPRLFVGYRQQTIALDVAHTDEVVLRSHLEMLLGGAVVNLSVIKLDLVNDTTLVDVRYRVPRRRGTDATLREPSLDHAPERVLAGADREVVR